MHLTSHHEPVPPLVPRPRRPVRLVVALGQGLAGREAACGVGGGGGGERF